MSSLFYNIEPYLISASGMKLTVLPLEDGSYRVSKDHEVLADLYPEITAAGIFWNGFGQLPAWFADEIGTNIFAYEI